MGGQWWTEPTWIDASPAWGGWRNHSGEWSTWGGDAESGPGTGERAVVPDFAGITEEDKEGHGPKSYLRKVVAWKRLTRLPRHKQAMALYNKLRDKAWVDAEELDLETLETNYGMTIYEEWIKKRYLDIEINKVGKIMKEFFRILRRKKGQDIRDFNAEFDRMSNRLKEIGCVLPGLCLAWLYVDKLRLGDSLEVGLLSSVGNEYDLSRLQGAAQIQDRTGRLEVVREEGGEQKGGNKLYNNNKFKRDFKYKQM